MDMDRLLELLDKWKRYMKSDNHKLGYPSKSLGMSSGGESSYDAFDEMYEDVEDTNVRTVDAVIHSLPKDQKEAIYARYLNTKKPQLYEYKLQIAIDNLLTIVGRRIGA
jgi:enoyl-[acyl-carrier-protein] reductase (NADH)